MSSRDPTSTSPQLDEAPSSSHSVQYTGSLSARLQAAKASHETLLTTARAGMPFYKTVPTPQSTNRRRKASSDSSSGLTHSIPTTTTASTSSSGVYSYNLDNSTSDYVDLDDFAAPLDATILTAPSFQQLEDALDELKDQISGPNPPSSQFIHVREIGQELFTKLEEDQNLFPGVRVTISHLRREVLFKVMPNHQHDSIIGIFQTSVTTQLASMGLLSYSGAFVARPSPRTQGRYLSKEPDWWLSPTDIRDRGGGEGFPTLALEVGVSESYPQLCNDAQWWYSNSDVDNPNGGYITKVVVIVTAARKPAWQVDIEVWTEQPRPSSYQPRHRQETYLQPTQRITYRNGQVHGAPMVLSFESIFRRPRNKHEGDIVLDAPMLEAMCQETS